MQFKQKLTESLIRELVMEQLTEARQNKETLQEGKLINSLLATLAISMAGNAAKAQTPESDALVKQMITLQQELIKANTSQNAEQVIDKFVAKQGEIMNDPRLEAAFRQAALNAKAAIKAAQQQQQTKAKAKGSEVKTPTKPAETPAKARPKPFKPLPDLT